MPIKNDTSSPPFELVKREMMNQAEALIDANQERILGEVENSDDRSINLSMAATLDYSETQVTVEVKLAYGKRKTDKRTGTVGDPDPEQEKMAEVLEAAQPKRGRGRQPKIRIVESESEEAPAVDD